MAGGPGRGAVRGLRVGTAAVAATGLAVAAHAWADGCVELGGALLGLACTVPAAVALTARRRDTRTVLLWLATVQVALHLILAAGCGGPFRAPAASLLGVHVLAVLITALVLNGADAALWAAAALRDLASRLLPRQLVPHPPTPAGRQPVLPRPHVCRSRWRSPAPARRGPPVRALAR